MRCCSCLLVICFFAGVLAITLRARIDGESLFALASGARGDSSADAAHDGSSTTSSTYYAFFVSSSHTYVNDVPQMVQNIAASAGTRLVYHGALTPGATLESHLHSNVVDRILTEQRVDFVLIQPASLEVLYQPEAFSAAYQTLVRGLRDRGATILLTTTWARHHLLDRSNVWEQQWAGSSFFDMASRLQEAYAERVGEDKLIPVGRAWEYYYRKLQQPYLHSADGNHAALAGSYVAALCIYGRLFADRGLAKVGWSPEGIDAELLFSLQEAVRYALSDSIEDTATTAVETEIASEKSSLTSFLLRDLGEGLSRMKAPPSPLS